MLGSVSFLTTVVGAFLVAFGGGLLYEWYLHPAWRKQRRVRRACAEAFDEGDYQLERLRVSTDDPSAGDVFSSFPFGTDESTRYFTYKIRAVNGAEPDFSGMDPEEIGLVRHYLRRTANVPHHGKEVLHPPSESPANSHSTASA